MAYLEIKDIYKSFGTLNVLNGVSLDIEKGEIITIIGSSGNGKTTLLRTLNNLESIDKGEVILNGEKILPMKEKHINYNFGMIFQGYNLFPQYTALENITLPMNLKSKKLLGNVKNKKERLKEIAKENEIKAKEILTKLGLEEKFSYYPCQLSGGQCQRVAIARAVALEPEVLCFDEPTSALDPRITQAVGDVINDLKKQGFTMIIITHDMDFAKNVSDTICFMKAGVIKITGTPDEIFNNPTDPDLIEFFGKSDE